MNKRVILPLLLSGLALSACSDTAQLYNPRDYLSGTFVEHCYNVWEGKTKEAHEAVSYSKDLDQLPYDVDLNAKGYFAGSGLTGQENLRACYGYGQALRYHPDYFKNSKGETLLWGKEGVSDIVPGEIGGWADNSSLYDVIYSQNKRLDRRYEKFSRGFLSKFYNGQIKCNGWSYYAMAVLSTDGYGTMFPYELEHSDYFAMAILMGTDEEASARVAVADIDVTFYKYSDSGTSLIGYQVNLNDVNLSCNNGSSNTSLVGFTFADAGIDSKGIVGMSMNWSLVEDPSGAGDDFDAEGYHDGICLYEVFFPDSTWN